MLYRTIYADPPWPYWDKRTHKSTGAVLSAYPTMDLESIKALPIQSLVDKDCTLLLWATFPKLREALDVMLAWGFTYKTVAFTWIKLSPRGTGVYSGLGWWTNGNAEIVLLGNKGHPKRIRKDIKQIVIARRAAHSVKPEEVRKRIEMLFEPPYLELFARRKAEGWVAWGNEIESDIVL